MNANDVKKALNCCLSLTYTKCSRCPYNELRCLYGSDACIYLLRRDSVSLLNQLCEDK